MPPQASHNSVSLPSFSVRKELDDGSKLDVMCTSFVDRDFVVVTQVKKLGTLVNVSVDVPQHPHQKQPTYDMKTLIGRDDDLMHVYARAIAEFVHEARSKQAASTGGAGDGKGPSKPVLCAISVKNPDRDLLLSVLDLLKPCDIWKN